MANFFTLRLAASNLKRSRRMVFPYFVATAVMSAMYFIISNVIDARAIANMSYGSTTMAILCFGRILMTIFIVLYMFYLNSFLIKPRQKEFGLYGVLGLEKRHVALVVFFEGLLLNALALAMGFLSGFAFGQLCFRALLRVTHIAQGSEFSISPFAISVTLSVFIFVFLFTSAYNLIIVHRASAVSLLSGEGKAEKKPRFVPLMAAAGLILLICAYAFAVSVQDQAVATLFFWPAVLLVIVATYLLFTSGSAFALSRLARHKRLYYRPRAFITIGFLKHRMKQNAAGLANICILSTMVLVTVIGCCALYFGQEDILQQDYTYDLRAYSECRSDDTRSSIPTQSVEQALRTLCDQQSVMPEHVTLFDAIPLPACSMDSNNLLKPYAAYEPGMALVNPLILPADSFTALTGLDPQLSSDEVLMLYPTSIALQEGMLGTFTPVRVEAYPTALEENPFFSNALYIVTPSRSAGRTLALYLGKQEEYASYRSYFWADLGLDQDTGLAITGVLRGEFSAACETMRTGQAGGSSFYFGDIYAAREENYALFGGLIFLGAFCAILFAVNTVLIIYFKQLSEGIEDRERYNILQKVGMDEDMVKHTINFQVLFIFFLPLGAALLHTAFALPLLCQIVAAFKLYNTALTVRCALFTAIFFSLCYATVFKLTARTYYKLVKRQ